MIEVEPENYPQLKSDPNIGISVTKSYDAMEIELRQNTGPFANEKVRAALEFAVDRAALNKVVFDGLGRSGLPAGSHVVSGLLEVAGHTRPLQPRQGQGDAQGGGLSQGRQVQPDHPGG